MLLARANKTFEYINQGYIEFDFKQEQASKIWHMLKDYIIPDMIFFKFDNISEYTNDVVKILNTNMPHDVHNLIFMNNDGSCLDDELTEAISKCAMYNVSMWICLYGFNTQTSYLNKILIAWEKLEWIALLYNTLVDSGTIHLDHTWYPNLKAIDIYYNQFTPEQEKCIISGVVNTGLISQLSQFNFLTPNKSEHDNAAIANGFKQDTTRYDEYRSNYFRILILKRMFSNQ